MLKYTKIKKENNTKLEIHIQIFIKNIIFKIILNSKYSLKANTKLCITCRLINFD